MRKLLTRLAIGALIVNVMIMVGSATSGMVDVNISDQTDGTIQEDNTDQTSTGQINDTEEMQTGVGEDQIDDILDGQDETTIEGTEDVIPSDTVVQGDTTADVPTGTGGQTPIPTQESPGFGAFLTIVTIILSIYIIRGIL